MAEGSGRESALIQIGLVAVMVLVVAFAAIFGAAWTTTPSPPAVTPNLPAAVAPPTGFGGYAWTGGVATEIGAQWRVPAVHSAQQEQLSSTWIGVQNRQQQFIQLGTYSNAVPDFASGSVRNTPDYGVFWSDTTVGFHPVTVAHLDHAGDLIACDLHETSAGVVLTVHDLTAGWTKSLTEGYAPGASYNDAEWVQEDPADALTPGVDTQYAPTSTVSFAHLSVDGRVPHLSYDTGASTLTTSDGVYLVPTHVHDNGFSLENARGAQRQYLRDAESDDQTLSAANAQIQETLQAVRLGERVDPATEQAQIWQQLQRMADSYALFRRELDTQSWPASDTTDVQAMARASQGYVSRIDNWHASGDDLQTLLPMLDYVAFHDAVNRLRHALGLPDVL